ncbi:unnamed protein product, partial [Amoebophrya sp. A120]
RRARRASTRRRGGRERRQCERKRLVCLSLLAERVFSQWESGRGVVLDGEYLLFFYSIGVVIYETLFFRSV